LEKVLSTVAAQAHEIVDIAFKDNPLEVIQPAKIGDDSRQNELLLFIKPEAFLVPQTSQTEKIVMLILDKIREYDADINGITVVGGPILEKMGIMSRHYGFINRLSTSASKILTAEDKRKIEEAMGVSVNDFQILGGHEYLQQFPEETGSNLDRTWFLEKSAKIRSGFYVRNIKRDGKNILLINGFHPEQLAHYTNPSHRIVLLLLHSNTDWSALRNEMVGHSFPENATPNSIRGILYAHPNEYGFKSVTIGNNCVHLSAGPFEAMFEIVNFFGSIAGIELEKQPPLALQRMLKAGISYEQAISTLNNPQINRSGKSVDLFTATEDMNTDEAIALFKGNLF
jgi:hypothetical protein